MLLHTGNKSFASSKWGSAKRALNWMITNAGSFGLPQKVTTTYDHFHWENYQTVVYNCHIYLTSLEAVRRMALVLGDSDTASKASQAFQAGKAKLLEPKSAGGP